MKRLDISMTNISIYRDYVSSQNTGPQNCTDTANILRGQRKTGPLSLSLSNEPTYKTKMDTKRSKLIVFI